MLYRCRAALALHEQLSAQKITGPLREQRDQMKIKLKTRWCLLQSLIILNLKLWTDTSLILESGLHRIQESHKKIPIILENHLQVFSLLTLPAPTLKNNQSKTHQSKNCHAHPELKKVLESCKPPCYTGFNNKVNSLNSWRIVKLSASNVN
jgi:hypothetical protein